MVTDVLASPPVDIRMNRAAPPSHAPANTLVLSFSSLTRESRADGSTARFQAAPASGFFSREVLSRNHE